MTQPNPAPKAPAEPKPAPQLLGAEPKLASLGAKREVKPLPNSRLKIIRSSESDFANLFGAVTLAGTPFSDVLDPGFWSNHASKLRTGDTIEIHTDDQVYFGRLLVRAIGGAGTAKTRVSVAQLERHEFSEVDRGDHEMATHRVEHRGPHLKWSIVRLADGKIMADGHETREGAETALKGLLRPAA